VTNTAKAVTNTAKAVTNTAKAVTNTADAPRREAQMTAVKTPVRTSNAAPAQGGPADSEVGSAAQRERRKRSLDATLALASKGGYDAVQMREVAERADVALGTLYRYFPSKIHLLVSGLIREFEQTKEKLDRRPIPGDTPAERIIYVLNKVTKTMQREPLLTEAITRAFMFADPSAAAEVNAVAALMEQMLTDAMHAGEPTDDERAIARVIGDVWLSNLVAWVTRRASANDVTRQLELAARLLLR
jgi:AcrR family transcriptional regulator